MQWADGLLSGADSAVNGFFGDADPRLAPKGQYTVDPYKMLSQLQHVQVQEKVSALEVLSAAAGHEFEQANKYKVFIKDSRTGHRIATLNDPYACIDLTFNIEDEHDQEAIQARASGCQLGLCCPCPCGPCSTVEFEVTDARSGHHIGSITKKVPSILKYVIAPDVDNYQVDFGAVQDPKMKAALIALSIFIDFRFFSNNSNDDSRKDALEELSESFSGTE